MPDPNKSNSGPEFPEPQDNPSEPAEKKSDTTEDNPPSPVPGQSQTPQSVSSKNQSSQQSQVNPSSSSPNAQPTPTKQDGQSDSSQANIQNEQPTQQSDDSTVIINTPSGGSGSGIKTRKFILPVLGVLLLVLSVGSGVVLVRRNQNIEEEASRISPIPCQIEPQEGRIIYQFNEEVLYSNHIKRGGRRVDRTSTIPAAITAGEYTLTLSSYDDHSAKVDQTQDKERYFVQFVDVNENEIALTNSMSDLPEDQDYLTEVVNSSLIIPQDASGFIGWHTDNPDDSSPNSIVPVCIALDPVEEYSASCSEVTAYDSDWNPLSMQQLTQLSAGEEVKFVVTGTADNGTIDKARFRINSSDWIESSDLKPGEANTFYINYTIPEDVSSFTVNGQVHLVENDNWY